jgi:hypothetical protein
MAGKRGLIMGLANDRSLAWGIAKQLSEAGAELAFSYQGESLEKRVRPLAEQLGSTKLRRSTRSPPTGRRSTSSSTRSVSPTRTSCVGSMSTPASTTSSRR